MNKPAKSNQAVATATPGNVTTTVTPPPKQSLVRAFATKLGVEPDKMLSTLKDTAFKQPFKDGRPGPEVTDSQMMALLVVANEYGLNPFLKEIYAFPTKGGGIAPMVGYDGWVRLVQSQPMFDGEQLADGWDERPDKNGNPRGYYYECTMHRKDRKVPTIVREYHNENWRNTEPWNQMPNRMTRNRAYIQCARMCFGFGGIYDPDEGERIANAMAIDVTPTTSTKPMTRAPQARAIQHETSAPPLKADTPVEVDTTTGEFQSLASEDMEPPPEDEAGVRG